MFTPEELNQFYRFCVNLTLDEHAAYDLLQTSLEKYLTSSTPKKNPRAFMYRVIRNQFIDEFRSHQKHSLEPFDEQQHADFDVRTLESLVIDSDLVEQLMLALQPMEREILYYWAIEGYSTRQIADMLEMPKGTVLSRIYRMRQKILIQFPEAADAVGGEMNS